MGNAAMVKRKKRLRRRRERRAAQTPSAHSRGDVVLLPDTLMERPLAVLSSVRARAAQVESSFAPERSGVMTTRARQAAELFSGDNVNRSEKAQIMAEPRPGVREARWRAYVERARAKDAELEGDWDALAKAVAEAWEWDSVAKAWDAVEV
jgi:hypothetical protein